MIIHGNRVLIKPDAPIDKTPSGISLSPSAVQKPNTGTVIVVGREANPTLSGQTVLYNPILAAPIDGHHLISSLDIKMIL